MKTKTKAVIIAVVILFLIPCLVPNPLSVAKAADGGTRGYSSFFSIVQVVDWNKISIEPHTKEGIPQNGKSASGRMNGHTVKGKQIFFFGICIYDGRYTVQGIHIR